MVPESMVRRRGYGWLRDRPDQRDMRLSLAPQELGIIPDRVDLRTEHMPPVYRQEQSSSCVGQSTAAALSYVHSFEGRGTFHASRQFIYWNARAMEGTTSSDTGAFIRDAMRACATLGACSEETDPFNVNRLLQSPTPEMYAEGREHTISSFARVQQTMVGIKACLAAGYPIIFGLTVYESFESEETAASGMMTVPQPSENDLGGHAVLLCGYDDVGIIAPMPHYVLVRNSWGSEWGIGGYFWMPYSVLLDANLCSDFWMLQVVA